MANVPQSHPAINTNSAGPIVRLQKPDYPRLRATHITSHAVTARVVGVAGADLDALVATETYKRSGATDDLILLESTRWADVRRGALIRLAGDVGEHVVLGHSCIGVRVVGGDIVWPGEWPRTTCTYLVTNGVRRAAGEMFGQRMLEIVRDTLKIVRANQPIIERVARELIKYDFISSDQLRDMVWAAAVVPDDVIIGGGAYVE